MPQYFNFTNLIRKYQTTFTAIIPSKGEYNDAGDYVEGEATKETLTGAIISMRERRILRSEGAYTEQDRALYMLEKFPDALRHAKIVHGGKEYRVESELENSEFTGVWAYVLKFVSAFNENGGDSDG